MFDIKRCSIKGDFKFEIKKIDIILIKKTVRINKNHPVIRKNKRNLIKNISFINQNV